jgi:hypothetical protein
MLRTAARTATFLSLRRLRSEEPKAAAAWRHRRWLERSHARCQRRRISLFPDVTYGDGTTRLETNVSQLDAVLHFRCAVDAAAIDEQDGHSTAWLRLGPDLLRSSARGRISSLDVARPVCIRVEVALVVLEVNLVAGRRIRGDTGGEATAGRVGRAPRLRRGE